MRLKVLCHYACKYSRENPPDASAGEGQRTKSPEDPEKI